MNYFKIFRHTTRMKKFAILLLSVFTVCSAAICGCAETNENSKNEDKTKNIENIQIQEDDSGDKQETPEVPEKPEFPDGDKRGNKIPHPHPHRPHIIPGDKLPRPIPVKP